MCACVRTCTRAVEVHPTQKSGTSFKLGIDKGFQRPGLAKSVSWGTAHDPHIFVTINGSGKFFIQTRDF